MSDRCEELFSLMKRRGFVYPSFANYGGLAGFYDYGPLGVKVKRNIENKLRKFFISLGFAEIEGPIITPEVVLSKSGHLKKFKDSIIYCKRCDEKFKVDGSIDECPRCGGKEIEKYSLELMFPTRVGEDKKAYLRPETAQGIFLNFENLYRYFREKLPFGAFQFGKGFRNELSPRQGMIRLREFTLAEVEFFTSDTEGRFEIEFEDEIQILPADGGEISLKAKDAGKFFENSYILYYLTLTGRFLLDIGIKKEKLRFRQHLPDERAHYARDCWDIEILLDRFGWVEVVGMADRGDYDLKAHSVNPINGTLPKVIEPSYGVDRIFYAVMDHSYDPEKRILKLDPKLSPFFSGVFPLMRKPELISLAKEIYEDKREKFDLFYDESGSIGKRYARADEVGIPFCITVDYDSLSDRSVTIRYRDTKEQRRVLIEKLEGELEKER